MKKVLILFFLLVFLTGCQSNKNNKNHADRFDNNPNTKTDIEMYNEEMDKEIPDCFSLCHNKIQDICMDEIVDILSEGQVSDNSIYNEEACEGVCMSEWSDDVRTCVSKANKCDSISQSEPYCKEEEDNSAVEYIDEKEVNYDCSGACYKYKVCAMMADDATAEDGNEAYNTCFGECQNWSEKTLDCIKKSDTGTAMGCAKLSACGLAEYRNLLK
jgi:hypothetical protein